MLQWRGGKPAEDIDRIVGALTISVSRLSDQTMGNCLRRRGIAPAPKRSQTTSWKDFTSPPMRMFLAGAELLHRGSY